jgi:predicted metal-dependent HD superfamily phosphohydrolase
MLAKEFAEAVSHYNKDTALTGRLWDEIEKTYTSKKRYYHNQSHLENLLKELESVKEFIEDWDTIIFSIAYHDIVYNTLHNDNEEQSAALAKQRLAKIDFPEERIRKCVQQILATKGHTISNDQDTNFFTDADLSILGAPWEIYEAYFKSIRKEYSYYPDMLYKPGRKKVLLHFLSMGKIFKTDKFFTKYEEQARKNLSTELNTFL